MKKLFTPLHEVGGFRAQKQQGQAGIPLACLQSIRQNSRNGVLPTLVPRPGRLNTNLWGWQSQRHQPHSWNNIQITEYSPEDSTDDMVTLLLLLLLLLLLFSLLFSSWCCFVLSLEEDMLIFSCYVNHLLALKFSNQMSKYLTCSALSGNHSVHIPSTFLFYILPLCDSILQMQSF